MVTVNGSAIAIKWLMNFVFINQGDNPILSQSVYRTLRVESDEGTGKSG